jgi:hypothetical protein
MYISRPKGKRSDTAVLYLPDAFGIPLLQNRLYVARLKTSPDVR